MWREKLFLLLILVLLSGCYKPYYEAAPVPPPCRLNTQHQPSEECTPNCIEINRIKKLPYPSDRIKALNKIIENPRLSCHEQLYIIDTALSIEMFGVSEVFIQFARHPYLRYSTRSQLLYYTNRLSEAERTRINQLLEANRGVPDELTKMEKLWTTAFAIDSYTVLDLYRKGLQEPDILILLYLHKNAHPTPTMRRASDWTPEELYSLRISKSPVKAWYAIMTEDLQFNPGALFIRIPPGTKVPEPFRHPYEIYWMGPDKSTPLTDDEIGLIVKLKVIAEYYRLEPLKAMSSIIERQ